MKTVITPANHRTQTTAVQNDQCGYPVFGRLLAHSVDKPAGPARHFLVIVSCPLFPPLPQHASDLISCAPTPLDRHHLFPVSLDHHSPPGYWHSFPLLARPLPIDHQPLLGPRSLLLPPRISLLFRVHTT